MSEAAGELALPGQIGVDDLEGYHALMLRVPGHVGRGHGAPAQFLQDAIGTFDDFADHDTSPPEIKGWFTRL